MTIMELMTKLMAAGTPMEKYRLVLDGNLSGYIATNSMVWEPIARVYFEDSFVRSVMMVGKAKVETMRAFQNAGIEVK